MRHTVRKANLRSLRKKRTFSLSEDSLAFLDAIAGNYRSHSEALDQLIRDKKRQLDEAHISASITKYYESLGDEELEENRSWGEFAQSQLPEE